MMLAAERGKHRHPCCRCRPTFGAATAKFTAGIAKLRFIHDNPHRSRCRKSSILFVSFADYLLPRNVGLRVGGAYLDLGA
jgi:hypothetical protein